MAACFEAQPRQLKVTLGRRGDVDNIGTGLLQHFVKIAEMLLSVGTFAKLARHERLTIAHSHDFASRDPLDLGSVGIRNLATTYDGNFKHELPAYGSLQNSDSGRPP